MATNKTQGPFGFRRPEEFNSIAVKHEAAKWGIAPKALAEFTADIAEAQRAYDMRAFADTLAKEQLDEETWEG